MIQKFLNFGLSLGLVAMLGACSSATGANPVSGGTDNFGDTGAEGIPADPTTGNDDVPEDLAQNLDAVEFNASADTLVISIGGLDSGSETSTYSRTPSLDVPGFVAFSKQDDPLDRFFVAFAKQSPDGTSQAFAISDGGQFNRYFGGTRFERIGGYEQPTSGLVSYAGEYAGTTNLGELNTAELLPVPAGLSDGVLPRAPARVRGNIFLNVDFSESKINGEIYDRELLRADGTVVASFSSDNNGDSIVDMPNITLIASDINADGTFTGALEDTETENSVGNYGGTFGGNGATSVAGAVKLDRFSNAYDNEEEYGAFALGRCGTAGASAICAGLGE